MVTGQETVQEVGGKPRRRFHQLESEKPGEGPGTATGSGETTGRAERRKVMQRLGMDQRVMDMLIRGAQEKYGIEIDRNDLNLCRRWINHMVKTGTKGVKITVGPEPDSWIVRIHGNLEH